MNRLSPVHDFSSEAIGAEKQLVEEVFAAVHEQVGYEPTAERPPYPSPDPTVLFVGAQISIWKPRLDDIRSGKESPSFCPQNCIRLQNKEALLNNKPITFNSAFRICGAVAPAASFGSMVETAEVFLGKIGVDPERIVIRSSTELNALFDSAYHVETNSRPDSYYQWRYGEDELSGKGLTFAIKSENNSAIRDIGNVIEISKHGEPIVAEWGTGLETLLSAVHSDSLPVRYATITDNLRGQLADQRAVKYVDAVATTLQLSDLGVACTERGPGGVLKEYVQGLAYIALQLNKYLPDIEAEVHDQAELRTVSKGAEDALLDRIRYYTGRCRYLSRIAYDTTVNGVAVDSDIAQKIGISDSVARLILHPTGQEKTR